MIIVKIQFEKGSSKTYDYLLLNPSKFKVCKTKPLLWVKGVIVDQEITSPMYIVSARKEEMLPSHVTSQIVLMDNANRVAVQQLGGCRKTPPPRPTAPITPAKEGVCSPKTEKKIDKDYPEIEEWIKKSWPKVLEDADKMHRKMKRKYPFLKLF